MGDQLFLFFVSFCFLIVKIVIVAEREGFEHSVFLCIVRSYEVIVSRSCLPLPQYQVAISIHGDSAHIEASPDSLP